MPFGTRYFGRRKRANTFSVLVDVARSVMLVVMWYWFIYKLNRKHWCSSVILFFRSFFNVFLALIQLSNLFLLQWHTMFPAIWLSSQGSSPNSLVSWNEMTQLYYLTFSSSFYCILIGFAFHESWRLICVLSCNPVIWIQSRKGINMRDT